MTPRRLLALALALALLSAPVVLFAREEGSKVDRVASDFTLKDLNGDPHTLSDYRGKEVLVYFWATW